MRRLFSSFSRYSLALDAAAFAAVSLLLLAAVALTLAEMGRKFLELRVADAQKVELFLDSRLETMRSTLERFADLPEADRSPAVLEYFSSFSEIYRLDGDLRVTEIYKGNPASRVFPGFAFSGGKLADYLQAVAPGEGFSPMVRGPEDDAASVYLATRRGDDLYAGRLDLDFIGDFLIDYAALAGTPVLLVSPEGFVIASGAPSLELYAFDLRPWEGEPSVRRTLELGGASWVPVVSAPRILGNRLVTFIPTAQFDIQRQALIAFWAAATVLLGGVLLYKNRKVEQSVLRPLSQLSEKMREVEAGDTVPVESEEGHRFREFGAIEERFRSMAQAIRVREGALAEASVRARQAAEAKSAFLANMSHEIRTPLGGVIGLNRLALHHAPDERLRGYLTKIDTAAQSLLAILNQILDFSKIEAGQIRVERRPFQPAQVVRSVAGLMEAPARAKGLILTAECEPVAGDWRLGDELRLKQVLLNLLSNAVKFTDDGVVMLVVAEAGPGRLRCEVRDTGVGLTPAQQEKIFQPFVQADESTTRRHGGTGLGLPISKELVELMGGKLTVRSAPGEGSAFVFELAAPPCEAPVEEPSPAAAPTRPDLSGRCVLVADDSAINREILVALFERTGARIVTAADGCEAVETFRRERCDLVLLDVQMPVMDGHEAARQIRALDAGVPIIAVSASAFPEDVARSRAAGMNEHLLKPLEEAPLDQLLRQYLAAERPGGTVPEGIDPALYRRWRKLFAEEFGDVIEHTQGDLAAGHHEDAARRMHKLSGSAGALGAAELSRSARELQQLARQGVLPPEKLAEVEAELSAFLAAR
jgi:signal transduction histidine kinase/DNA-binding NarL/FixJ family response regulator